MNQFSIQRALSGAALVGLAGGAAAQLQVSSSTAPAAVTAPVSRTPSGVVVTHNLGPQATLTQSVNNDITPLNSIACNNAQSQHADNWYFRVFDASAFGSFTPTSMDVGIEAAAGGGDMTQPIRLRLYDSADLADTLIDANIIYDSGLVALADVSGAVMSFLTTGATASTSGSLIAEVFTPDGQATGESFFLGTNANGQTGPSYLRADGCGVPFPTDLELLAIPNVHFVLTVTGDTTPLPPFRNYCTSVPNSSGSAAVLSATGSNSIADSSLTITAAPVPDPTFYLFYYGPNQLAGLPFGNGGFQCVGGHLQRMPPPRAAMANMAERTILPGPYTFTPSTTIAFQCWFRDNQIGPDHYNTSDGLTVDFVD